MIEGRGCPTGDFGHDRKIVGSFEFGFELRAQEVLRWPYSAGAFYSVFQESDAFQVFHADRPW
jgi:hypothetical protein